MFSHNLFFFFAAGNDKTSNLRRSSRIKKNDASISSFAGMCANWMQNVELMHTKRQLNRTMLPKRKTAVKVTEVEEVSEKRSRINAVANKTNNRNIKNIGNDDNNPNNHNNNIESNSDKNKKKTIPIENEFVRDLSDMIWLDLLCDPNFDVTVAEKSSDFDVYFIDINDKKIGKCGFLNFGENFFLMYFFHITTYQSVHRSKQLILCHITELNMATFQAIVVNMV